MKRRFDIRKRQVNKIVLNRIFYVLFGAGIELFLIGVFSKNILARGVGIVLALPAIFIAMFEDKEHCDHYLEQVNSKTYRILK